VDGRRRDETCRQAAKRLLGPYVGVNSRGFLLSLLLFLAPSF